MSVPTSPVDAAGLCAETFNSSVAAAALSAAWDVGVLDELRTMSKVDVRAFADRNDLHRDTLIMIMRALAARRIVELDTDRLQATQGLAFDEAYLTKGFFYWLTGGCGELFRTLPGLVRHSGRTGDFARRDAAAISVACRDISRAFFDEPFHELLSGIEFSGVVDLGCGSGDRIIALAESDPGLRAVGVDLARGALMVAGAAVAEAGLEDRVTLVRDNVLGLLPRPEYHGVELVTCFLMGHDFWPRENCVRTLVGLREAFPDLKALVLGDTCRSTGVPDPDLPVFSLGFEMIHAATDVYLPSLREWYEVIEESGWRLADQRLIDLPAFSFIFHLSPR